MIVVFVDSNQHDYCVTRQINLFNLWVCNISMYNILCSFVFK